MLDGYNEMTKKLVKIISGRTEKIALFPVDESLTCDARWVGGEEGDASGLRKLMSSRAAVSFCRMAGQVL